MAQIRTKIVKYIHRVEYIGANVKPFYRVHIPKKIAGKEIGKHCKSIAEAIKFRNSILQDTIHVIKSNYNKQKEENQQHIESIKKLKVGEFYTIERSCLHSSIVNMIVAGYAKKYKQYLRTFQGESNIFYILKIKQL